MDDKAITKITRKMLRAIKKDAKNIDRYEARLKEVSAKLSPELKTRYTEKYGVKFNAKEVALA